MREQTEIQIPQRLVDLPRYENEKSLYYFLARFDDDNDLVNRNAVTFTIGPSAWADLSTILGRSVQTMKRWLKTLDHLGWASMERISKDTHRVTLYADPAEKGKGHGTEYKEPAKTQGDPPQH